MASRVLVSWNRDSLHNSQALSAHAVVARDYGARRLAAILNLAGCALLFSGCSEERTSTAANLFSPRVKEVVLEVDYQTGAEPYFGQVPSFGDLWHLFASNAQALFAAAPKTLIIPATLEQAGQLPSTTDPDFTVEEILDLAEASQDDTSSDSRAVFHIVFLDGYFSADGKRELGVLGVSLGRTGVIAMFKPVIAGASTERYVEQSTLIHEFGHAVGLVENGIPTMTDHLDDTHPAHCTNKDCAMYYLNEGAKDLAAFIKRMVKNKDSVMFGKECLDDTKAATNQ